MTKKAAKGAIIAIESATPGTYTTIPSVGDFDFPLVGDRAEIDVTSHDSEGDYDETVLGTISTPAISVPVVAWDGANTVHASLVTAARGSTAKNFKVTTVDTKSYTFAGFVKGVVLGNPVKGAFSATVTIKPSGAISDAAS